MGKGRPRAVEKGVLGLSSTVSSLIGLSSIPSGPVYYPTEDEFKNPIEFILKIKPEAEPYGICKIVPPASWKPPFALDLNSFTFPTKTQAIHQLQERSAPCDPKTFELEYNRFLEGHCGKKLKKKIVFEGEELDLCKLFNAVKRYGGYDKVLKEKKWGKVALFVLSGKKASECGKHVLCQLYWEHLYDYEKYYNCLNQGKRKGCRGGAHNERKRNQCCEYSSRKRRRKNTEGERIEASKLDEEELDQICEQCQSGLHGEVMLLCDRCNKGWHIYCLSPPLKLVPPGNWYCLECSNSDKDSFGFVPGKQYSLETFRRLADRARRKWVGPASSSRVQLERKFWEIVEGSVGEVEVMYGSDLDTSSYGSGFPRSNDERPSSVEVEVWDEYCASPWNLNNLPKLQGSMLRAVRHSIAGVMVPWLYIGMLFSSFCWHFEDHCLYSMNYLHWGEPKCWYSVPGCKANAFEKVMRNSLPDLFDAQPDLLFHLVTMLNPSVLQQNSVPVYSVLQEPGNFVITFPRSYHGGFNFGLNCAEAVNFAPADWLPHGGFGAELYRLYHKAAVLCHEELLCVLAKSDFDSNTSVYLKKELCRIYDKEKTWRHCLWRNGILSSSPMSPRKRPEYVGSEEDPTCIICHQNLHLSAVVCHCRPSDFVCLEHWEHLCECDPNKHRLLYRHTLAELNHLVLMTDKKDSKMVQNVDPQKQLLSDELNGVSKKAKGAHVTLAQLAEEWCLSSSKILQIPYCGDAYVKALKEAEQFLWAGSEMDLVRQMVEKLVEAQTWAEGVRDYLSKVEKWSCYRGHDVEKVHLEHFNNLLRFNPAPCDEPAHLKLKHYEQEAIALIQEINSLLSTCPNLADLEALYSKVCDLPIHFRESEKLFDKLSSAKIWIDNVRKCISEKCPAAVGVDTLYKLQLEMSDLSVQAPESDMLLSLIRQVDSCRARCSEMLNGSINLKKLQTFFDELDGFAVDIPELKLLRQNYSSAVLLISRFNGVLVNIQEREDQENVVDELNSIQKDRALLKIEVDELSLVEIELKKACWRVKALKVLCSKMPLEIIHQLMMEASTLQIEKEKLFTSISGVLAATKCWEERAKYILASEAQMLDFEDALRTSEEISATLPSLDNIKDALSMANSWLKKCEPFLLSDISAAPTSVSPLKIEDLKDLVSESKHLKISLKEPSMLQVVLNNCMQWELEASLLLHDAICLLDTKDICDETSTGLVSEIEKQVSVMESSIKVGISLGFDLSGVTRLQGACSVLCWCCRALSFCSISPQLEEVEMLMAAAETLPVTHASSFLFNSFIEGLKWLKKAAEISSACNHRKFKISDAEGAIEQSKTINVSFPLMVTQLVNAISKHILWQKQVKFFFSLNPSDRRWNSLLELKELGIADAFDCPELDMILSEVQKIEQWKQRCHEITGASAGDTNLLLGALVKITDSLDRSLYMYGTCNGSKVRDSCIICSNNLENQALLSCSICKHCYHLQCLDPTHDDNKSAATSICLHCPLITSGKIVPVGDGPLRFGGIRPDLDKLIELLSEAEHLFLWFEERNILQHLVEKALACRACLTEVVEFALAYLAKDPCVVAEKLSTAMKAVEVAGVYDHQNNCKLEQALARNSWRIRATKILEGSQKPQLHAIIRHLKEVVGISIPPEDHIWQRLTEVKHISVHWADKAKKVSMDLGALELDKVFDLITEGENLPVHMEKELELLRDRSMLYCICRKPYDQKPMIACDNCDEWYHFDCIELFLLPKQYVCPACKPKTEEDLSSSPLKTIHRTNGSKCEEPQTPSPRRVELRRKSKKPNSRAKRKLLGTRDGSNDVRRSSGIEHLLWKNRKPFRRAARKRLELSSLSPLLYIQNQV